MNGSLKLLRGLFLFVVDDPLGRRVEKPVQFPSFRRDPNRPKLSVISLRLGKKKNTNGHLAENRYWWSPRAWSWSSFDGFPTRRLAMEEPLIESNGPISWPKGREAEECLK